MSVNTKQIKPKVYNCSTTKLLHVSNLEMRLKLFCESWNLLTKPRKSWKGFNRVNTFNSVKKLKPVKTYLLGLKVLTGF